MGKLKDPFNKYCIDCKKRKTTHAIVFMGIYVCESCSKSHFYYTNQSRMSTLYIKDIF